MRRLPFIVKIFLVFLALAISVGIFFLMNILADPKGYGIKRGYAYSDYTELLETKNLEIFTSTKSLLVLNNELKETNKNAEVTIKAPQELNVSNAITNSRGLWEVQKEAYNI